MEETRTRIRHKLQSSKVSFDDLAPLIEHDPALCLNMLQRAVKLNPDCQNHISGAASCLSLIGMQELVRLMKSLPAVRADSDDPQQLLYLRALQTAHLAGNLAAWWTQIKGNPSVSYARWSTMLASAPLWAWLRTWPQAGNWFYRLSEGDDLTRATHTVFGKDPRPWQKLCVQLHLPLMAMEVFSDGHWPTEQQWQTLRRADPRDLNNQRPLLHACQQPAMIALMANQLAWQLHIAPLGAHFQRWLDLAAHWLGKPVFILLPQVRDIQLGTSRQQHSSQGTGLHLLLSPHPTHQPYPWIGQADAAVSSTATVSQQPGGVDFTPLDTLPRPALPDPGHRHTDDAFMKKLLRQLQQEPDSFGDWHYLMRGMLKGVTDGIGLPSACIALLNKEKTALKVFYSEGMSDQTPMRRFIVDLRRPSLFSKLLAKPTSLMLTAENREKYLANLPEAVTALLPPQAMMMSIDAGAAPIGLVMGFAAENQPQLTAEEYASFTQLCRITSQSLATLRVNTEARRRATASQRT